MVTALAVSVYVLQGCGPSSYIGVGVQYSNPAWAPPYYNGVRYYYLPDIECYYDLSAQEFVYLNNGQWFFSPVLPSIYSSYDLYNGFIIALDIHVYQPWRHHQYYVSHYPRYYYRNYYSGMNWNSIRGFNENIRKPIPWRDEDRNRINELRRNEKKETRMESPRQPQNPNYYGRNIGRPVKVKPQMKETKKEEKEINTPGYYSALSVTDKSQGLCCVDISSVQHRQADEIIPA